MKAFPTFADNFAHQGMDLRDYFAAAAMQGILASDPDDPDHEDGLLAVAILSYNIADALMKAREVK
jgi:hypothetical protein